MKTVKSSIHATSKTILGAVLAISAFSASAIDSSSSWEEIRQSVNSNSLLSFDHSGVFVGKTISVFDTCVDGNNLKSTKPVDTYGLIYDNPSDEYKTVKTGSAYLEYPLTFTNTFRDYKNSGDERYDVITQEVTTALVREITVQKYMGEADNDDETRLYGKQFTKTYTIPACS